MSLHCYLFRNLASTNSLASLYQWNHCTYLKSTNHWVIHSDGLSSDRKHCMHGTRLSLEKTGTNVTPPIPRVALLVHLLMRSISRITFFFSLGVINRDQFRCGLVLSGDRRVGAVLPALPGHPLDLGWPGNTLSRQARSLHVIVKSPLSWAASLLAALLDLKNRTSCCRKPQFQRTQWSSAGEVCQKVHKHYFWHRAGSLCNVARCPAKTGTSFTLRASGFLMGAILLPGQEMSGNTVLSS